MTEPLAWLGVMLAMAVVSFLLSGMEAGLFALNPVRIRNRMRKGVKGARALHRFLQDPETFLWTILVGNTLANFLVVVLGVVLLHRWLGDRLAWALGIFAAGVFVFHALADLLPKMLFQTFPNRLCLMAVPPFRLLHNLLSPLVGLLRFASQALVPPDAIRRQRMLAASREEFRMNLQETQEALTSTERLMIGRVMDLPSVEVGQLATPLSRVVTVAADTPLGEVLLLCRGRRLTRLPVWEGGGADGRGRIAGVISLKTLLYQPHLDRGRPVQEFLKPALFLAEDTPAEAALVRMRRSGQRLAIILGPGRRESGVVSLEDILRFVFGEVGV